MADEKKIVPTWGYSAEGSRIFSLEEGESLPEGWVDSPAKVEAAKAAPTPVDGLPKEWRDAHHSTRIKLAKQLVPDLAENITSAKEADEALEAYELAHPANG